MSFYRLALLPHEVRMGYVYRPRDLVEGRKKMIEQGMRDIEPSVRGEVLTILQDWRGEQSMDRLRELVGEERAKRLRELASK